MKNVLYWKACISDLNEFQEYSTTIDALLNGEYKNLDLEQLQVTSLYPIYSIRHSHATRILFTTFQDKICILEVILNHDYAKSRFLRNRHAVTYHLEKISESISTSPVTEPHLPSYVSEHIHHQPILFHQDFIQLNEQQEHAIHATFPMVLHGPAGSGKTTVAIELLQKLYQNEVPSIIYITESNKLRNYVQNIWQNLHLDTETPSIQFLTYQDFLTHILDIHSEIIVDKQHFQDWYEKHHSAKNHQPETLYKEFRILSGYPFEQYQTLGARQCHYHEEQREEMIHLFDDYQKSLGDHFAKELNCINTTSTDTHLIIDEAQDFSFAQLKTLLNYADTRCAILLGDHQVLFDDISKFPFIKQHYYEKYGWVIQNHLLRQNYRCSHKVSDLVNLVTHYKYHLTGGCLDKIEITDIEPNFDDLGRTEWMKDAADTIKQQHFNPSWAIINFSFEPQSSFNHPLVFTPAESKGLEFDTIILWKPFENNLGILNALRHNPMTKEKKTQTHRAKAGQENLQYLSDFNTLITAMTRAKSRLIIIDNLSPKKHPFLNELSKKCISMTSIDQAETCADTQEWFNRAQELIINGSDYQAKRILIDKLQYSESEFQSLSNKLLLREEHSRLTKSPVSVSENLSCYQTTKNTKLCAPATEDHESEELNASLLLLNTSDFLTSITTHQLESKALLDYLQNNRKCLNAFIFILSIRPNEFSKFRKHIPDILKILTNKNREFNKLLKFIDENQELCDQNTQNTFFHLAASVNGHPYLQRCLDAWAEHSIDLNKYSHIRDTALHYLIHHDLDSIKQSLEKLPHFNIYTKNHASLTLLDIAIIEKKLDWFKYLIQKGVNPYLHLELLIKNEMTDFLKFIIEFPSLQNLFYQNKIGILELALKFKSNNIIALLKTKMNLNEPLHEHDYYPIHLGVLYQDLQFIADLIQLGVNINQITHEYHETPLHLACKISQPSTIPIIQYLLNHRANYRMRSKNLLYPIDLIIKNQHWTTLDYFIEHGLNPHDCYDQNNIVHIAAKYIFDSPENLEKMITKYGIDLNQKNHEGTTPLLIAVETKKKFEILKILCDDQTNLDTVNSEQHDLIYYLRKNDYDDAVFQYFIIQSFHTHSMKLYQFLENSLALKIIEPIDIHLVFENEFTNESKYVSAIYYSMNYKTPKLKECLLTHPRGVDTYLSEAPFFHLAAKENHLDVIEFALNLGVDINIIDELGNTALHYACKNGYQKIVNFLVDRGSNLNAINHQNQTPFILACKSDNFASIGILIKSRAEVIGFDKEKRTSALMYLAKAGRYQIINKIFENYHLDVQYLNSQDRVGMTALFYTFLHHRSVFLREKIDSKYTDIISLVLRSLLSHKDINPNISDNNGVNVIHAAAEIGNLEIMEILLSREDIHVNVQTNNSLTPLFIAAQYGFPLIVKILLERGADQTLKFSSNSDNLRLFASKHGQEIISRMENFIESHLTLDDQNITMTPLDIAQIMGHHKIVELLTSFNSQHNFNIFTQTLATADMNQSNLNLRK